MTSTRNESVVIEWLQIKVTPELRETFIQRDTEIWTPALARNPGFLGKEVWISPDDLSEVVMVIRWASFEAWQAIPSEELQRVEAEFSAAMGDTYEIVSSKRYQVRKFA